MSRGRTNTAEKVINDFQAEMGEIPISIDTPSPEMAANAVQKQKDELLKSLKERTGASIPREDLEESKSRVKEIMEDSQTREAYIKLIKQGKIGLWNQFFKKFPAWQIAYIEIIAPIREQIVKELEPMTMAECLILDLILLNYYEVMVTEREYSHLVLALDVLQPPPGKKGIFETVQVHLSRLYQRLNPLIENLVLISGNDKVLKVKEGVFKGKAK